ncbi:MAG: AAA family ATPase [Deltaproteobacteria bacterium]|nr:AAA family ATPase [Deltaproteobacteria bacterium]
MITTRLEYLKRFSATCQGAEWHKVNLHVHASGQDPDKIVDAAIKADISLIAITDHNTFRFVKPVQEAALRKKGADLVVLPGIEITLEEGAHIIAIFDNDFDEKKQNHFIGVLKLPVEASAKDAVKDKPCSEVLTDITDAKGITLVPHPFSNDIGFLDKARKIPTKMAWLESGNIGLIQIADDKVKFIGFDNDGKWQNRYVLRSAPPSIVSATDYCLSPLVPGEAKTPDEIENAAIWLKLGSRNVRGLRQVTCEPRTRISEKHPSDPKRYKLLGLTIEGGFFDGLEMGFSPDFTCIIGENHSGKTAIFDFISFALGRDKSVLGIADREDELDILLRRLNAILQPNGRVNLYLSRNSRSYCISRTFIPVFDKKGSKVLSVETVPEVLEYDPDKDELVPGDFEKIATFPETYTQGHVGILRRSVKSQLSLIDDLAGLAEHRKQREELTEQLRANADELADLYDQKEGLAGTVGSLTQLEEELRDNEKHLEATGNNLWQTTASVINNVEKQIESLEELLSHKQKDALKKTWEISRLNFEEAKVALPDLLRSISAAVDTYNESVDSVFQQLEDATNVLKNDCSPLLSQWKKDFSAHKELVSKALRKQGFDSPEQLLNKVENLRSQINKIQNKTIPQLEAIKNEIGTLAKTRNSLLEKFKKTSEVIAQSRKSKIDELNKTVGPDIIISLERPDPQEYIDLLKEVCGEIAAKDRRIQKRDEQLALVGIMAQPSQVLEAILNDGVFRKLDGKTTTLVKACGITQNTQEVLCTIKGQSRSLHKLQVFEAEPVPKITVRREGTERFADLLTELSPGEQSSTILALALMARDVPLIIDQPEDELGYSYIVNKIVPKILEAKKERQVILISHNANIPVLADAEFLVKIRNDPVESQSKCTIEEAGTFAQESVCNKLLELEGGERAFQMRQYRYAIPRRLSIY